MYKQIIEEVCSELNIKYTYLSKGYITKLEKDNKVKYLSNSKFDLNNYVNGRILDDKYAFYEVLNNLNIPVCIHNIFYREDNKNDFAIGCNTKKDIIDYFNKHNKNVVVKPNDGYMGKDVYHITNIDELIEITNKLFKNRYSIGICPFYNIKNEYRVIFLDNEIKLLYKKINPVVVGDGKSTIKELLIKFNPYFFSNLELPNIILKENEKYTYDFHFNLSKGSIASLDIEKDKYEKISLLAKQVVDKLKLSFVSIDIIETIDNELLVLEGNSGVMISKATEFIPNGYEIAKSIYKEAIIKLFN